MSANLNLSASERVLPIIDQVAAFIKNNIVPVEPEFLAEIDKEDRWTYTARQTEILEGLKAKAKEQGLWNFFLTEGEDAAGLTTVEYAYIAELTGSTHLAPEVFNCAAPDTGNMEVLEKYGSKEQKEKWLKPLLAGEIRSCFAMTEPDVASSDATNLCMPAVLDGDEWVINGEKTYISGAGDPRCKIMICMVMTNPDNAPHQRQSQILVPMDTPGIEILRPMLVFGQDDAPHGHMHIRYTDVRVPKENIILGEGRGFEIAQGRLGPGRIHHCMRLIGLAEKALELLCERSMSRTAFGKPLARLGANFDIIANARMEIDQARLLTLRTALAIDSGDFREANVWISKIKVVVPNVAQRVIDEAIQMHGARGISQDFPLAGMWAAARSLRLADGPDAVHRRQVARNELKKYM